MMMMTGREGALNRHCTRTVKGVVCVCSEERFPYLLVILPSKAKYNK